MFSYFTATRIKKFLTVLFTLIVIYFIVKKIGEEPDDTAVEVSETQVDYYLKGFNASIFKANGELNFTLNGEQLRHFKNDDSVAIDKPTFFYEDKDLSTWTVTSQFATASSGLNTDIVFSDEALIQKQTDDTFFIKADNFVFSPDSETFISNGGDKNITIQWGENTIKGSKMVAKVDDETFTLQDVRATYVP